MAASVSTVLSYHNIRRQHHWHAQVSCFLRILHGEIFATMGMKDLSCPGFSREAFEELHEYLCISHKNYRGHSRPRLLNTRDELDVILFYLGSKIWSSELCLIFGCTPSRCNNIINHQLETLSRRLNTIIRLVYINQALIMKRHILPISCINDISKTRFCMKC